MPGAGFRQIAYGIALAALTLTANPVIAQLSPAQLKAQRDRAAREASAGAEATRQQAAASARARMVRAEEVASANRARRDAARFRQKFIQEALSLAPQRATRIAEIISANLGSRNLLKSEDYQWENELREMALEHDRWLGPDDKYNPYQFVADVNMDGRMDLSIGVKGGPKGWEIYIFHNIDYPKMPLNVFHGNPQYVSYDSFLIFRNEDGGVCYGGWASDGAGCFDMIDSYKYKSKVYAGL